MADLFWILAMITGLFFLFLITKKIKGIPAWFCALCAAVFFTWTALLISLKLGIFSNNIIVALLMGQSITGIMYLIEKKAQKDLLFFRLPLLLTLTFMGYFILQVQEGMLLQTTAFLLSLWCIFSLIYLYRNKVAFKVFVDRVVRCCMETL